MVNLSGLNMLNQVKAGTQQRSSASSAKDSAGETFKDVFNRSEDKPEKQTQQPATQRSQQPVPMKSQINAGRRLTKQNAEHEVVELETPEFVEQAPFDASTGVEAVEEKPVLWDGQKAPEQKLNFAQAMSVESEGMPGAPDPSSGMKNTPDFALTTPMMMASVNPMANKAQDVAPESQIDSLTRRAVWSDFLRRMHEELGVSAEKILEAFSTLDEKELAAPAEQNVDKLVMALGLNGEQNQLAHKLFTDLIRKTQTRTLGQELASSSTHINLSLMSQREMQRRNLQNAIDKMNSAFFMSAQGKMAQKPEQNQAMPIPLPGQEVLGAELAGEESTTTAMSASGMVAPMMPTVSAPTMTPTAAPVQQMAVTQSPSPNQNSSKINKLVEEMEPMTDDEVAEYTQAMNENTGKMFARSTKVQAAMASTAAASAMPVAPTATSASSGASAGAKMAADAFTKALGVSSASGSAGSESQEEAATEDSSAGFMVNNQLNLENSIKAPGSEVAFKLSSTGVEAAPAQMSVPDMINQARVMVREGGGEMKVSLSPEGLGEVAMKVSVENGRVNVEMITESDSAKKMIEKGLVDLKSSLHANNLSVDSIKVDTASNLGRQLEQQYQDAQRQQARAFMENFRQNDQGWRRENFMTPSVSIGRSQSQAGSSSSTPYPTAKRSNAARRLDLVA